MLEWHEGSGEWHEAEGKLIASQLDEALGRYRASIPKARKPVSKSRSEELAAFERAFVDLTEAHKSWLSYLRPNTGV